MGGQARNKKRRAGRYGKVKLKNRTYAKFIPPQIKDPVVRAHWDPRKSRLYNMSKMGLQALPNADIQTRGVQISKNQQPNHEIQLFDIPESDSMTSDKLSRPTPPMSVEQQIYIAKCMAKYGDDYSSMEKDIKMNNMQHNENQLRKIAARFILLNPEQRKVDVPEKVQHLM